MTGIFSPAAARAAALAMIAVLAGVWCTACTGGDGPPEQALRLWVETAEAAVEAKDRAALLDMIATSYADARGNSRDDIDRLLRYYFLRQQRVMLLTGIDEIRAIGESAGTVLLTAGMTGSNAGTFGFSADAWRFELELEADGGDWRLIGARWAPAGGELR